MEFVTLRLAKLLEEKGFNWDTYEMFERNILACRYEVLKWLREEKGIMVFTVYSTETSRWYCSVVNANTLEQYKLPLSDSFEHAYITGIEYVLNNLI